jgi:hypothetical protein
MRLVPRQLQRAGMTGNVPYYGGRLGPAQAYAVSHSAELAAAQAPPTAPAVSPAAGDLTEKLTTLQQLVDEGVITEDEFRSLRARVLQ